jgi:hypothetical protein
VLPLFDIGIRGGIVVVEDRLAIGLQEAAYYRGIGNKLCVDVLCQP